MSTIPKVIHYCWFGGNPHNDMLKKCLESRKKYCPDYDIIERNEQNIDVFSHPFMAKAYKEKKRAFVSDVARLQVLEKMGGIYLDTDMELIKPISIFLKYEFFIGMEDSTHLSCGIIGAKKSHPLIVSCLKEYTAKNTYTPIPNVLTRIYKKLYGISTIEPIDTTNLGIFPPRYFYPFHFTENFSSNCIQDNTYGIHRRNHSRKESRLEVLLRRIKVIYKVIFQL